MSTLGPLLLLQNKKRWNLFHWFDGVIVEGSKHKQNMFNCRFNTNMAHNAFYGAFS